MKVSKHLSLTEVTHSNTAVRKFINNTPNEEQLENLKLVAEKVFEPVRVHFDTSIGISSGFRCEELNKAIGGSKTSDHCKGMALDIDADLYGKISNLEIGMYIYNNLEYSQLIFEKPDEEGEPRWIHVSYNKDNLKKETLVFRDGKYIKFN